MGEKINFFSWFQKFHFVFTLGLVLSRCESTECHDRNTWMAACSLQGDQEVENDSRGLGSNTSFKGTASMTCLSSTKPSSRRFLHRSVMLQACNQTYNTRGLENIEELCYSQNKFRPGLFVGKSKESNS